MRPETLTRDGAAPLPGLRERIDELARIVDPIVLPQKSDVDRINLWHLYGLRPVPAAVASRSERDHRPRKSPERSADGQGREQAVSTRIQRTERDVDREAPTS